MGSQDHTASHVSFGDADTFSKTRKNSAIGSSPRRTFNASKMNPLAIQSSFDASQIGSIGNRPQTAIAGS